MFAIIAGTAGIGYVTKRYFSDHIGISTYAQGEMKEVEIDFAKSLEEG